MVSIASPRVFQSALHTGSDTGKEYGLHTFPRAILKQLEAKADAKWLVPFSITPAGGPTTTTTGVISKNFSIRFGSHRDSIYNNSHVTGSGPLAPTALALTRQAHAGTLTQYHPSPLIMEEILPDYQTAIDSLSEEPDLVILSDLKGRFFQTDEMDAETTADPPVIPPTAEPLPDALPLPAAGDTPLP